RGRPRPRARRLEIGLPAAGDRWAFSGGHHAFRATGLGHRHKGRQRNADEDDSKLDGIGQGYTPQARQGRVGNKQQRGNDGRPGGVQANDGQGAFGGPDLGADNADNGQQREQGGQRGHRFAAV